MLVLRYNSDGTLDNSFGANGVLTYKAGISGDAVALQPDGKIVVTGSIGGLGDENVLILRLEVYQRSIVDFDGDVKTDIGLYRVNAGAWFVIYSSMNETYGTGFGGDPSDVQSQETMMGMERPITLSID